jgi:hypothetical protein
MKRGLAQPVLMHNLGNGLPAGLLLQHGHNLDLAELSHFHVSVISQWKLRLSLLTTGARFEEAHTSTT